MQDALSSLTLGDSLYVDRDYEGALENFTAAICLTDSRRINKAKTTSKSTSTQDVDKDNTKANEAETKVIRLRSLSHRSETYMSLDKFTHAYNDANAALSLYPPNDILDSATPSSGLRRPSELALAHDRIARACVGLAKANMGVAARTKSGRVSFIKLSGPGMANTESEMEEEAREHWETALVLAGMLDSNTNAEEDGGEEKKGEDGDGDKKKKEKNTEGARLVERFQRELKKLDEEDVEEEETKKKSNTTSSGLGDVMDAMKNSTVSGDLAKNTSKSKDEDSPSKSAPNPSSKPAKSKNRSTGGLPSKTPSDHPACYVSCICINLWKVCMRCAHNDIIVICVRNCFLR